MITFARMSLHPELQKRSNASCELCSNTEAQLTAFTVQPKTDEPQHQVVLCATCLSAIQSKDFSDDNHWRCLTGSIWNETPAVQALSYKILSQMKTAEWATETMESVFLDESVVEWALAEDALDAAKVVHKDSYGVVLEQGDTVILTQNLNVKGANFIAPKGTIVRKIRLVPDNGAQIEGKINGDTIVILTQYVRKATN